jgi:hypothetical protein
LPFLPRQLTVAQNNACTHLHVPLAASPVRETSPSSDFGEEESVFYIDHAEVQEKVDV